MENQLPVKPKKVTQCQALLQPLHLHCLLATAPQTVHEGSLAQHRHVFADHPCGSGKTSVCADVIPHPMPTLAVMTCPITSATMQLS